MLTLQVEFDRFLETVREVTGEVRCYAQPSGASCFLSAASVERHTIVTCAALLSEADAISKLVSEGATVGRGRWTAGSEPLTDSASEMQPYVAAIAYVSSDAGPGVWVDAFESLPTEMQALREMYDEFRETGELSDVAFEEFVRLAKPTVVVVSPAEIRGYAAQKTEPEC